MACPITQGGHNNGTGADFIATPLTCGAACRLTTALISVLGLHSEAHCWFYNCGTALDTNMGRCPGLYFLSRSLPTAWR